MGMSVEDLIWSLSENLPEVSMSVIERAAGGVLRDVKQCFGRVKPDSATNHQIEELKALGLIPNHNTPWTQEQKDALLDLYLDETSTVDDLIQETGRTVDGYGTKLRTMTIRRVLHKRNVFYKDIYEPGSDWAPTRQGLPWNSREDRLMCLATGVGGRRCGGWRPEYFCLLVRREAAAVQARYEKLGKNRPGLLELVRRPRIIRGARILDSGEVNLDALREDQQKLTLARLVNIQLVGAGFDQQVTGV